MHIVRDIVTFEKPHLGDWYAGKWASAMGRCYDTATPMHVVATPEPMEAGVPHLLPPTREVMDHRAAMGPGLGMALP